MSERFKLSTTSPRLTTVLRSLAENDYSLVLSLAERLSLKIQ